MVALVTVVGMDDGGCGEGEEDGGAGGWHKVVMWWEVLVARRHAGLATATARGGEEGWGRGICSQAQRGSMVAARDLIPLL